MFASLDDPMPKDNVTSVSKVEEEANTDGNADTAVEPNCASPTKTLNPFSLDAADMTLKSMNEENSVEVASPERNAKTEITQPEEQQQE